MRIVRAGRLPPNPKPKPLADYCAGFAVPQPHTAGGRIVATRGWIVTSETKLGAYDAVTFVGGLDPATSATCAHVDGNLAVFERATLKALAYEKRPEARRMNDERLGTDAVAEDSLGSAEQVDAHRIRLSRGLPGAPFADVVLSAGISIEPVAAQDAVCGGAAILPNVFGEDIRKARIALIAKGWLPQKPTEPLVSSQELALAQDGVVETASCAGTGYGYCGFSYHHRKGFDLSVVSTGEDHQVTRLDVSCGDRTRPRHGG